MTDDALVLLAEAFADISDAERQALRVAAPVSAAGFGSLGPASSIPASSVPASSVPASSAAADALRPVFAEAVQAAGGSPQAIWA